MPDEKRRVNAAIDMKLYENVMKLGYSISEAITLGLEKLLEPKIEEIDINTPSNETPLNHELITGYQSIIKNLEEQLKAKDDGFRERIEDFKEQLKIKDSQLEIIDSRMEDRVRSLEEQLRVKDTQLENKDSQLEKQAIHIQTMISQKAIEAPGAKKPWWQFW